MKDIAGLTEDILIFNHNIFVFNFINELYMSINAYFIFVYILFFTSKKMNMHKNV